MKSLLFLLILFLCGVPEGYGSSLEDVEKRVLKLFEGSETIPQIRVTPEEETRYIIELTFSIGDRWGRDGAARDLARVALTKLFRSNLPLAQGIVKIYCAQSEILHVAIGLNQAKQIRWTQSSSEFFDGLRACIRLGKKPEDRTYLIESRPVIRPSPVVLFSPNS